MFSSREVIIRIRVLACARWGPEKFLFCLPASCSCLERDPPLQRQFSFARKNGVDFGVINIQAQCGLTSLSACSATTTTSVWCMTNELLENLASPPSSIDRSPFKLYPAPDNSKTPCTYKAQTDKRVADLVVYDRPPNTAPNQCVWPFGPADATRTSDASRPKFPSADGIHIPQQYDAAVLRHDGNGLLATAYCDHTRS